MTKLTTLFFVLSILAVWTPSPAEDLTIYVMAPFWELNNIRITSSIAMLSTLSDPAKPTYEGWNHDEGAIEKLIYSKLKAKIPVLGIDLKPVADENPDGLLQIQVYIGMRDLKDNELSSATRVLFVSLSLVRPVKIREIPSLATVWEKNHMIQPAGKATFDETLKTALDELLDRFAYDYFRAREEEEKWKKQKEEEELLKQFQQEKEEIQKQLQQQKALEEKNKGLKKKKKRKKRR